MEDLIDHKAALAQRIRAELRAGATLDEVLGALRVERCGPLMAIAALKHATGMGLGAAKTIVSEFCEGRSFAHLTLAELDALGDAPRVAGVNSGTSGARDYAIMNRKPWLLYAPLGPGVVAAAASSMPLDELPAPRSDRLPPGASHPEPATRSQPTQSGRPTLRRHLDVETNVEARDRQHGGQRASGRGLGLGPRCSLDAEGDFEGAGAVGAEAAATGHVGVKRREQRGRFIQGQVAFKVCEY